MRSRFVGMRNGTREDLIVCFARLMRCAIVLSGTRKALAISAVVSPPTARSVSAMADEWVSAGWQHMKSRTSVSSRSVVPVRGTATRDRRAKAGPPALRGPPGCLAAQVIRHAAGGHVNQPAARVVGHAFRRPLHAGGDERFLHRIFGGGEILEAADRRAENLRRELAQQILGGRVQSGIRHTSTGGALITSRTSIGMFSGFPPVPGAADAPAAIS